LNVLDEGDLDGLQVVHVALETRNLRETRLHRGLIATFAEIIW
jgi:hypothetical protein